MLNGSGKKGVRLFLCACFLLLTVCAHEAFPADPLASWRFRSPFAAGNDLHGIAYLNGLYVAVGNNGTLLTSTDQAVWTPHALVSSTGLNEPCLYSVAYGAGLYVAVGTYVWTSSDGENWTYRASPTGPYTAVAYGNGVFVAAGGTGGTFNPGGVPVLATSNDGITWVDRSTSSGVTSEPTKDLIFANGKFVQVAWHQTPYYSTNGLTWTSGQPTGMNIHSDGGAYGNGVYAVLGDATDFGWGGSVLTSSDGVNWSRTTGPAFYTVCFGNGIFMALGGDGGNPGNYGSYTSNDGLTWTSHFFETVWGNRIAASPGSFTIVGSGGSIYTTPDGVTWTARNTLASIRGTAVSYGNGLFVIVGSGGSIYTSPDGAGWTARTASSLSGTNFKSVAYGAGGWVAAGSNSSSGAASVATSPDGVTWTLTGLSASPSTAIAYGNETYIGIAGSTVYSSGNGSAWTVRASDPNGNLNDATFGNGKFVAVGDKTIMMSTDGITWTSQLSGVGYRLVGVVAGNGKYAAAGEDGTIRVSTDGATWTDASSGISGLSGIAFGLGRFVAVGDGGSISYSTDGVTWTPQSMGYTGNDWAIAFGNSTFVAVSNNTILQSGALDPLPEPTPTATPTPSADPAPAGTSDSGGGGGGGGCFIATAAYGGDFAWQVRVFKEFRDKYLLASRTGREFVRLYYAASPPMAALIAGSPTMRFATRLLLTPIAYGVRYPVQSAASFSVIGLLLMGGAAVGWRSRRGRKAKG